MSVRFLPRAGSRTDIGSSAEVTRQANAALYRIVIVRMRWHQPTIDYVRRRTVEGLSKKDIIRCLKRFVAREVYHALIDDHRVSPACAEAA